MLVFNFLGLARFYNSINDKRKSNQGDMQSLLGLAVSKISESHDLLTECKRLVSSQDANTFAEGKQTVLNSIIMDLDSLRSQHELMLRKIEECRILVDKLRD